MTWTRHGEKSGIGNWSLERDATLRLRPGREGLVVRATAGTVLVTQKGDLEDHVLERGAELRVRGDGLVVAWALTPAALSVRSAALAAGADSASAEAAARPGATCAA
jgi:hypothetical protein